MRTAFIEELTAQARINPAIFLVVGDLGYSVIEPFAAEFPDRFLNAGVAEQNMAGLAAGLASEGFHVFTYSIANGLAFGFITYAVLKLFTGKVKEVHWIMWVIAALFLFKFIYVGGH
jgi:transketolase C-terminal domain/subunit